MDNINSNNRRIMEIKSVDFIEQYLYEKPKDNYFRGISVNINGVRLLSLNLEHDREPITNDEIMDTDLFLLEKRYSLSFNFDGAIPSQLTGNKAENDIFFLEHKRFLLSDIEGAKKETVEIIRRYIQFFVK